MPSSSLDTFFACSLMVILVASAMVSVAKLLGPHLDNLSEENPIARHRSLAEFLLLSPGEPADWGEDADNNPCSFGLASQTGRPYELDLDKVSRMNSENAHAVAHWEISTALGIRDLSINIKVDPLFEVAVSPVSNQTEGNHTAYAFTILTTKSGQPISTELKYYTLVGTHIKNGSGSTTTDGTGLLDVTLPNSPNGTTLLLVLARSTSHSQMISFTTHTFGHRSETPQPPGTFFRFSPINHTLEAVKQHPNLQVSGAYVFTYSYRSNILEKSTVNETIEFAIPKLLEACPMILVVNGNNDSASFCEWTSYPQLPLELNTNFDDLTVHSNSVSLSYTVTINSALYSCVISSREVQDLDV